MCHHQASITRYSGWQIGFTLWGKTSSHLLCPPLRLYPISSILLQDPLTPHLSSSKTSSMASSVLLPPPMTSSKV